MRAPQPSWAGRGLPVGVDLAGTPRGRTGVCVLGPDDLVRTSVVRTDQEVIDLVTAAGATVVGIDAPLFLPLGRPSLEVPGPPHLRACDRWLLRMGIRFFPISLGPMRQLTARGIALAERLRSVGTHPIETYPGAGQDILGQPRKGAGVERLRRALARSGIRGDVRRRSITHDELDAITCAWIARDFLRGDYLAIGDPREGWMILPSKRRSLSWLRRKVPSLALAERRTPSSHPQAAKGTAR